MTGDESRQITLTLSNPEDRERSRFAEGMVIEGDITHIRKMNRKVSIKPGGKEVVAWAIYPEDAVYGRLVLFRVYVKQTHSTPSLEGTCGVLVLDIPILTGRQVMGVLLGLTLTLILSGNAVLLFLYVKDFLGSWHRYLSREMGAMSLFTLLGIWAAYVGNGTFGFIFLLTAFFMLSHLSLRSLLNRVFGSRDA
jgi:hypothetical protein